LDLRSLARGIADRAVAVAAYARRLPAPPILIGHGAGAIVALAAAAQGPAAAVVLIAPLVPGSPEARGLATRWGILTALLRGRPVPPPTGRAASLLTGDLPPSERASAEAQLGSDSAAAILDVARGRIDPPPAGRVPAIVLSGDRDPLLPSGAATTFARRVGAEHQVLGNVGHWLLAGPSWQRTVDVLHRWLVQRLGEPLLELYPEAMADRDVDDGD
jgi:pimeloyl-ACP methyl ester carboxylesterase